METTLTPRQIWYREIYLNSDHWISYREKRLERANYRCERCDSPSCLQVHHLSYDNLWNESMSDCEVLCSGCHRAEHGIKPMSQEEFIAEILEATKGGKPLVDEKPLSIDQWFDEQWQAAIDRFEAKRNK